MTIKQQLIWMGLMLPLAACSAPSQHAGEQLATDLRDNIYNTSERIQKWVMTKPVKPQPQPVAATYCYSAYQDILCYRAPMPGWEDRLVAYQGTNAMPPAPAMMQTLPSIQATDVTKIPTKRIASAKPVYVTMPEGKSLKRSSDDNSGMAPDAAHEQLPNPANSPQL